MLSFQVFPLSCVVLCELFFLRQSSQRLRRRLTQRPVPLLFWLPQPCHEHPNTISSRDLSISPTSPKRLNCSSLGYIRLSNYDLISIRIRIQCHDLLSRVPIRREAILVLTCRCERNEDAKKADRAPNSTVSRYLSETDTSPLLDW